MSWDAVIQTFSEEQAQRLTGLSERQLRHWDRSGFLVPRFADDDRSLPFSRIYSFLDIASLRTLAALRHQYGVSLQHLRKVADRMKLMNYDVWTGTTLYVLNRKVIFEEPGTGRPQEIVSKQYVMPLPLRVVVADTRKAVRDLWRRPGEKVGQVEKLRGVSASHAVIAGTRVRVASVKRLADDGYSEKRIIQEFPQLTPADVRAALAYDGGSAAA